MAQECPATPEQLRERERRNLEELIRRDALNRERYQHLRALADGLAAELAKIAGVQRVVLPGPLAVPLATKSPSEKRFRRLGVNIAREYHRVTLAVWVSEADCFRTLQRTRNRTVDAYYHATGYGVSQQQVDICLIEADTDRFLGHLCLLYKCPRPDRKECTVPWCGAIPHLRQYARETFDSEVLSPEKGIVLFDRCRDKLTEAGESLG